MMNNEQDILARLARTEQHLAQAEMRQQQTEEELGHTKAQMLRIVRRSRVFGCVGLCAVIGSILVTARPPAIAFGTPGVNLAALVSDVNSLMSSRTTDESHITALTNQQGTDMSGISSLTNQQGTDVTNISSLTSQQGTDKGNISSLTGQQGKDVTNISTLQSNTAPITTSGKDLYITGVNVHIVNGMGYTASTSGLGNLIIGYDALGNSNGDVRTGSHNLILGDQNNYSSFGGIVDGNNNTISGGYASVIGGASNTASGYGSNVSGGFGITESTEFGWAAGSQASSAVSGNFRSP